MTLIVLMTMDKRYLMDLPQLNQHQSQAIHYQCHRHLERYLMDHLYMNYSDQHLRRHFHCNCLYLHCVAYDVSEYCRCSNCCGWFHLKKTQTHTDTHKIKIHWNCSINVIDLPLLIVSTMSTVNYNIINVVGSISQIIPLIDHMLCCLCIEISKWYHIIVNLVIET